MTQQLWTIHSQHDWRNQTERKPCPKS